MEYTMDQRVERIQDVAWLKSILSPDYLKDRDLLSFRGAEFEFATCPAFTESVAAAASQGLFGFSVPGSRYKERVCWWMENVRKTVIDPEWILTTQGTIFSLATSLRLVTKEGEGMIMFTPGYNRYEQAANRLNRKTVKVPMELKSGRYEIDWEALEKAMADPQNKLLAFCNPNNPSGRIYTEEELKKIANLADRYQILVYCDEIFADVALYGHQVPLYTQVAGPQSRAISVTGMGKLFSLTGVNHANVLIANPALYEEYKAQRDADHYGSLDPLVAAGLVGSFNEKGAAWLQDLKVYVQGNLELIRDFFAEKLPEVRVMVPEAGYVAWIDFSGLGLSEEELHEFLAVEGGFDGDEGEEYYGPVGFYRYCLALPRPDIKKALAELAKAIERKKSAVSH